MANMQMLDKDNGEIQLLKKPVYTGFNAAINNLEIAAGNRTKIQSKHYDQMMELSEQILSIRIQAAFSVTAEIIGNYFETIEDIFDRSYTQMIKVLSNPNIPQAIQALSKSLKNIYHMIRMLSKAVNLKMILFPTLTLSNLKQLTTSLNHFKVTSYSLPGNISRPNSLLV